MRFSVCSFSRQQALLLCLRSGQSGKFLLPAFQILDFGLLHLCLTVPLLLQRRDLPGENRAGSLLF